jgi:sugar lactone lactonase YvrE
MNKFLKQSVCIFIIANIFWACDGKEEPQSLYLLVAKDAQMQMFDAEGGNVEILVNANVDFTVVSSTATWLTATKGNKSAEGVVLTITVNTNESEEGRTAKITLSSSGVKNIEINIIQSGLLSPLVLTSFEPEIGGYDTEITLIGENFGDMKEAIKVYFNDKRAEVAEVASTRIKAIVPRAPGEECTISVVVGSDSLAYPQTFTYQYTPHVYTVASGGDYILPSGIAVDENDNIVFVKRYEGNQGIYRMDQNNDNAITLLSDNNGGDPTGIIYEQNSGKFYVNIYASNANIILTIDTKDQWKVEKHTITVSNAVTSGGKWGLALHESSGKIYTRYQSGDVVKIDPTTWQGESIATVTTHGSANESWAFAFQANNPDQLWFVINQSSEMGYLDVSNPDAGVTWLNTTTERGYLDGLFANVAFNEAKFMCSDANGRLYLADQGNHAIRMITDDSVRTFAGGNDWGDLSDPACDGPALSAKFGAPEGICIAHDGSIYVGDTWAHRIRKIVFE